MWPPRHFLIIVTLLVFTVAAGTIGFELIEGWGFMDALYMTVITIATVGYQEIRPLGEAGRVFNMVLIFFGLGTTTYVAASVVRFMVEGRIRAIMGRRRLDRRIDRLRNHYIVCGYGRIGRILCQTLQQKPVDLVAIEKSPDLVPVMEQDRVLFVQGEATSEETLQRAGIARARGLVAVLGTDTDNVFLVLTARQLAPQLMIIARTGREESKNKLRAAGANIVESPYELGASRLAQRIMRPAVTSFLDSAFSNTRKDIQMEELAVSHASPLAHLSLKDSGIRQKYNLIIIAIKNTDGAMLFNPSFETTIQPGDTVIAVGEVENLDRLENALNP
ncbi:MAG: potassium channel protein [Desulfobacterales bacterium]|jgi:voltage-gated potassium channel|nr:potassium channel protein [Desulfobacterales bacterium]